MDQVFELRTYSQLPGRNPAILARFRDHTMKIFKSHDIKNIAYFTTIEKDPAVQSKLVYLVAHPSEEAAKANWGHLLTTQNGSKYLLIQKKMAKLSRKSSRSL